MKIYIRKLKDHDITHQISIKVNIVEEFFENCEVIKVKGKNSGEKTDVKILLATDPRFNAGINHIIDAEGGAEVEDIFAMYKESRDTYTLEVIRQDSPKFALIQEMCEADKRHTLLYIDNREAVVDLRQDEELNKEKFKNWLIENQYSESTTTQYVNHVKLASKEAIEKGICDCSLYCILDLEELEILIEKIKETEEFQSRKEACNNINEAALNIYLEFAKELLGIRTIDESVRLKKGYNMIVYGIPGCGKSYHVMHDIIGNDPNKGDVYRTTFYPDYTNGDFVGQVTPKLDKKDESSVLYDIQSGPFTDALLNAILKPAQNTYLIIEEINRGNAAAIFGDIFQLLDRDFKGISEYPIKNYIISTYLHKMIDNKYLGEFDLENLRIPSNLIIIGTMNTSDQNVFTLDTAFKRRWKMKYVKNDIETSEFASEHIPNTNVTWAEFVREINNFITSDIGLDINGEDKQIGAYFISRSEWDEIKTTTDSKEAARIFAEKILSYIWNDVAKINRDSWFDSNKYRTLDSVVSSFVENGLTVFNDNINFTREKADDNRK